MDKAACLLVGEVNPYGRSPDYALYPLPRRAAGNRLRIILGVTDLEYLAAFTRVNLCDGAWSVRAARAKAAELLARPGVSLVVGLGARVRDVFGFDLPFFGARRYMDVGGPLFVSLPHPSGRCREWNKPGRVAMARTLMNEYYPGVNWGSADPKRVVPLLADEGLL